MQVGIKSISRMKHRHIDGKHVKGKEIILDGLINLYKIQKIMAPYYSSGYYYNFSATKINCKIYDEKNNLLDFKVNLLDIYNLEINEFFPDKNSTKLFIINNTNLKPKYIIFEECDLINNTEENKNIIFSLHDELQKQNELTQQFLDGKNNPLKINDLVFHKPQNVFGYVTGFTKKMVEVKSENKSRSLVSSDNLIRIPSNNDELQDLKTSLAISFLKQ